MNDIALRQNIIDELNYEPSINAASIGVAVENGIVTLTGHVPTYYEKNSVADAVCRVKGVRGIAQEIEVRPLGSHGAADDEIAKRALNVISWNTVIPNGSVPVRVQDDRNVFLAINLGSITHGLKSIPFQDFRCAQ